MEYCDIDVRHTACEKLAEEALGSQQTFVIVKGLTSLGQLHGPGNTQKEGKQKVGTKLCLHETSAENLRPQNHDKIYSEIEFVTFSMFGKSFRVRVCKSLTIKKKQEKDFIGRPYLIVIFIPGEKE